MRSSTRSTIELLALAALIAWAPAALAQERPSEAVRALVEKGQREYDVGRFDAAIDAYSKAYAAQPVPALLFNLGQCHRQRGELARASFFYKRYLDLSPEGKNAPVARELVTRLDRTLTDDSPRRAPRLVPQRGERAAVVPAEEPQSPPLYQRWWFWTGVGAVATATVASVAVIASRPPSERTPTLGTGSFR